MKKRILLIQVLVTLFSCAVQAQKFSLDTNYVEKFRDKIVVVLFNSVQYNSIDISKSNKDSTATSLSYPTYRSSLGMRLSYKFIGFSFGTNAYNFLLKDQINEQKERVGDTKITSYGFVWNPNRIRLELYYQKIVGFHEDNRASYDPNFTANSVYYQYPKMTSLTYGADILWTFNGRKRYSIGAPYSYTTRQKKNAGSFILYFGANQLSLQDDRSFIPAEVAGEYGNYSDLIKFNGSSLSWGAGYGFTFVIAKVFFANLTALGRFPFMWRRFETATGEVEEVFSEPEDIALVNFAIGRAAVGFNFKRFFVSAYVYTDRYDYSIRKSNNVDIGLTNSNIKGAVLGGMRFAKPKKAKPKASF